MNEKAHFHAIAPQFVVPDVRETAEWYRDKLGFDILGYFFEEPPVFAIVQRGNVMIHFGRSDRGEMVNNRSIREISSDAYILVENIEGLYAEFSRAGVSMPYPPTRRIYARTEIEVTDCNGHIIVFAE